MYQTTKGNTIGYEYKEVTVPRSMESAYADGYANFGWEFNGTDDALQGETAIILKFKRDRRIKNKAELNRLEREFESGLHEVVKLERKSTAVVMGSALGLGILGAGFLVGAVFSFIASNILLGIILLIPAIVGWVLGYFTSVRLQKKKSQQVAPQIDSHYDSVYQVCEKANNLIAATNA